MTNPLGWTDGALCALPEHRNLLWFPDEEPDRYLRQKGRAEAQEVCARCPVALQCRAYAESRHVSAGVWGGRQYYFEFKRLHPR